MAFLQITNRLDAEKARLEALLIAVPAPTNYQTYIIKKSLAFISLMRQQSGELDADYAQRINIEAQKAVPGNWSSSFWSLMDSAVASDTAEGSQGGRGRAD